jgi:hypothetical protein
MYYYRSRHSKLDLYLQHTVPKRNLDYTLIYELEFYRILDLLYSCHVKKVGVDFQDCKGGIWNLKALNYVE